MRKYIGTRTISKNTKNMNRSRLRKAPIIPASSRSIQAKYGFSSLCGFVVKKASGKRIPVSTTRSSEMPSTPRYHEIPQCSIHSCWDTNWKPASPESNAASSHRLSAAVTIAVSQATSLTRSARRLPVTITSNDPAIGTSTSAVRIGNEVFTLRSPASAGRCWPLLTYAERSRQRSHEGDR